MAADWQVNLLGMSEWILREAPTTHRWIGLPSASCSGLVDRTLNCLVAPSFRTNPNSFNALVRWTCHLFHQFRALAVRRAEPIRTMTLPAWYLRMAIGHSMIGLQHSSSCGRESLGQMIRCGRFRFIGLGSRCGRFPRSPCFPARTIKDSHPISRLRRESDWLLRFVEQSRCAAKCNIFPSVTSFLPASFRFPCCQAWGSRDHPGSPFQAEPFRRPTSIPLEIVNPDGRWRLSVRRTPVRFRKTG